MSSRPDQIERVVGLLRVSTEQQEKEGYSLAAQKTAYERDCRAFAWRSLGVFQGQETGSSLADRQTVHELIAFVRQKRPDAIWVIEQSRLTRGDELDVALLIRELREHGTKVVVERGSVIDPSDLEGSFLFALKALLDRREWATIRARNERGKNEKAKHGLLVSGRAAYGYTTSGEGRERGKRVPVPNEAAVVKQIFEWVAEGLSLRQVVEALYERGIPAPTQVGRVSGQRPSRFKNSVQLWGRSTVRRILENPLYLGVSYRNCWRRKGGSFVFDRSNPKAIWIENAHHAIITPELWKAAHRQLDGRRCNQTGQSYMLTGLLACPRCGGPCCITISQDSNGRKRRYYVCRRKYGRVDEFGSRHRAGSTCASRWYRQETTDLLVWDAFVRLVTAPDMIERYIASGPATEKRQALQAELERLTSAIQVVEHKLARAREKLLSEVLTDGEYLMERERLKAEVQGLQRAVVERQQELRMLSGEVSMQVIRNLAVLKLGETKLTVEQRSRVFRQFVKRVRFAAATLEQVELQLFVASSLNEGPRFGSLPPSTCIAVSITLGSGTQRGGAVG